MSVLLMLKFIYIILMVKGLKIIIYLPFKLKIFFIPKNRYIATETNLSSKR